MTERSRASLRRSAGQLVIGPSRLGWDGHVLTASIDERANPLPRPVRGRISVRPTALATPSFGLDPQGRHRWAPIAPTARIEVAFSEPALRWQGHAYVDCNEGDEPITAGFEDWDWQRATLADGTTLVVYDVRSAGGSEHRPLAVHFGADGRCWHFQPPPRQRLPATGWQLCRAVRRDPNADAARVLRRLEDTPFYSRSLVQTSLLSERVVAVHESLDLRRLRNPLVRAMLPFRMPRVRQ